MIAKRPRLASLTVVGAMLVSLVAGTGSAHAAPLCADGGTQGCWSAPFSPFGKYDQQPPKTPQESKEFPAAATSVVMPDGRVVYWNGLQDLEDAQAPLASDAGGVNPRSIPGVLDMTGSKPIFFIDSAAPGPSDEVDDLFCSDQRLTSKGSLVAVGGTRWKSEFPTPEPINSNGPSGLAELYGSKQQHILNGAAQTPATDTVGAATSWTLGQDMNFARWYPTMITVPSGEHLVAGGVSKLLWNSKALEDLDDDGYDVATEYAPYNVKETELRRADGTWVQNPAAANVELPLYARMHLLPDGRVLYSGTGQAWGPAGESADQLAWNDLRAIDASNTAAITGGNASWQKVGQLTFGFRSGAFSTMLPLRPPYTQAEILVGGGTLGTSPGGYIATNISEKITVAQSGSGWTTSVQRTPDLVNRRWFSSAVALPNGQVVALNGADADEVIMPGPEGPVRQAELWDGQKWVPLAAGSRDRTYHNSAILLPDGSILVGGHAPINRYYGDKGAPNDEVPGRANNLKDPSFERLFPPYIANGNARPKILTVQAHRTWGDTLTLTKAPGSVGVDKVVLSRLPSATHSTDADLRTVEIPITANNGTSVSAAIPTNRAVVTPGYYYVFALAADGTPSVATILQVADAADYDGRAANATPVEVADTGVRAASGSPVVPVGQPAGAAKARTAPDLAVPADAAPVAAPVRATPRGGQPVGWVVFLGALAGTVARSRRRQLARAKP